MTNSGGYQLNANFTSSGRIDGDLFDREGLVLAMADCCAACYDVACLVGHLFLLLSSSFKAKLSLLMVVRRSSFLLERLKICSLSFSLDLEQVRRVFNLRKFFGLGLYYLIQEKPRNQVFNVLYLKVAINNVITPGAIINFQVNPREKEKQRVVR